MHFHTTSSFPNFFKKKGMNNISLKDVLVASRSVAAQNTFNSLMRHPVMLERLGHDFEPTGVKLLDRFAARHDGFRGARFCDVGCGRGVVTQRARELGATAIGIDVSEKMIEHCRAQSPLHAAFYHHYDISPDNVTDTHITSPSLGAQSETDESLHIPEDSSLWGSFDVVFSLQALFYMADYERSIAKHVRLLKPGGTFVLAHTYYSENRNARNQLEAEVRTAQFEEQRHQPNVLVAAYHWARFMRRAGLTLSDPELILLPDGDNYLYIEGTLKATPPLPTPSDTLRVKFPKPLPEVTNFFV